VILLVDLSAEFWRAFHASGAAEAYHLVVERITGLMASCPRMVICCEGRRPVRFDWFPEYKANRPPKPLDATQSLAAIIGELCSWGLPVLSLDAYEADDLIATLAIQATEPVQILSRDKDLYQLLSDNVSIVLEDKTIGPAGCFEKFGVRPDQMRDFLALCGDSADNIPGCPNCGPGRARSLLYRFGTLDALRAAPDYELLALRGIGKKTITSLRGWDPALALKLVTLIYDAPVNLKQLFPSNESETDMADMTKIVTERSNGPLKILAYGPEGVGKTRFGAFSAKPIFLCAEKGLSAPDLKSTPAFPAPDGWADVLAAVEYLHTNEHSYKTLVIDSLDWLHQHVRAEVCRRENMSPSQYEDYGRGEKHAQELWIALARALDTLQERRSMHIIVLAHSSMETFQNPQGEDFVRYQLALSKKAAERWKQWPDFLLFLSQEMFTKKNKDDKSSKGIIGEHRIFTTRSAAYDAKNRIHLPEEIPYETENPWRPFAAAVREILAPSKQEPQTTAA